MRPLNKRFWAWNLAMVSSTASIFLDASSLQAYPGTITASSTELPTSLLAIIYPTRLYVRAYYRTQMHELITDKSK